MDSHGITPNDQLPFMALLAPEEFFLRALFIPIDIFPFSIMLYKNNTEKRSILMIEIETYAGMHDEEIIALILKI
ncbi:MAG: hypothetical protein ACLUO4_03330 [Christensenellales bacterium]